MTTKIREARQKANVRQQDVAEAVGRTGMWLCNVEAGKLRIRPDQEAAILRAIARLAKFREAVREAKRDLLMDLRVQHERCRSAE